MFPFSALLTHAELTQRKSGSSQAVEARRAPRRMRYGNLTLFPRVEESQDVVRIIEPVNGPRVIASISNVSATGVGLILSEELPGGLEFDVTWPQGEFPVPLRFSVVHSQAVSAGMYRTGAILIQGIIPEEAVPGDFVSTQSPDETQDEFESDSAMRLVPQPDAMVYAGGVLKIEPNIPEPASDRLAETPPGTFSVSAAFGFDKSEKLDGVTSCGWERSISIRRDGARLWLYIHSPGKKNGWGLFVNPDDFLAALGRVTRAAESPFISTLAA